MAATVGSLLVNLETNVGKFAGDLGKASASVRNLDRGFGAFGRRVGGLGKQITAGVTLPILGWGAAAIQSNEVLNEAFRTIQSGTGASGAALDGLNNAFRAVFGSVPDGAAAVSSAIADLNTHPGATGATLETLTTALFKASRALGEDGATNAKAFGSALAQFEQPASRGVDVLDQMFVVSQNTGVSLSGLIASTNTFGSVLKNAGFTIEESAAIFGSFESVGISVSRIMPGLNAAFRKWAVSGLDAKEMLFGTVDAMQAARSDTDALRIATEAFGAEGAQRMTAAVRSGTFAIENLTRVLGDSSGAVDIATAKSATMSEVFATLRNKAVLAFEPLGADLRAAVLSLVPVVEALAVRISDAVTWFKNLDPIAKKVIVVVAGMAAAAGPLLIVFAQVAAAIPAIVFTLKAFGLALAAVTSPIGLVVAAVGGLIAILWQFDKVRTTVGNGLAWLRDKVFGASDPVDDLGDTVANATGPVEMLTHDVAKLGAGADKLAPPFDIATGAIVDLGAAAVDTATEAQALADTLSDKALGKDVKTLHKAWKLLTPTMQKHDLVLRRVTKSALGLIERGGDLSDELETLGMAAWLARTKGVVPLAAHLDRFDVIVGNNAKAMDRLGAEMIAAAIQGFGPVIKRVDLLRSGFIKLKQPVKDFHKAAGQTPKMFDRMRQSMKGFMQGLTGGKGLEGFFQNFGTGVVSGMGEILSGGITSLMDAGTQLAMKGLMALGKKIVPGFSKIWRGVRGLFGPTAEQQINAIGNRLGFSLSEGLQSTIAQASRDIGDDYTAVILNLKAITDEQGSVMTAGYQKVARTARDAFSMVEQGHIRLGRAIQGIEPVLRDLADEFDNASEHGQQQFLELIAVASSMGVEFEELARIVGHDLAKRALGDGLNRALFDADGNLQRLEQRVRNFPASIPVRLEIESPTEHHDYALEVRGFEGGTGGQFVDFGKQELVALHGREMIIPEGQGVPVADLGFSGVEDRLMAIERLLLRQPQQLATATRDALIMTRV